MALRPCVVCKTPTPGARCPTHALDHHRGSSTERGYGSPHQRDRARWKRLIDTHPVECARCGEPIHPWMKWDLDHTDDRQTYLGPSHAYCNRAAGGRN